MREKKNQWFITIIACVCICAVVAILAISIVDSTNDASATEKYNREKAALEYERTQLLLERERVENDIYAQLGPGAFLTFLVINLDDEFVAKIHDEFSKYSLDEEGNSPFCATLLLSPTELPGMEGKMTLEQFNWYLEQGYRYGIAYDASVALDEYLDNMYNLLLERDIVFPTTICYYGDKEDGILKESDKPLLEGYGILIAASMKRSSVKVEQEMYDGIFSPGVLGWNTINYSANTFNYANSKGGNYGFVIGNQWKNTSISTTSSYLDFNGSERYNGFLRMLERIYTNIKNGKLVVTDFVSGAEQRREYLNEYEKIKPTLVSALEVIDNRLDEIEKLLSEISDKYKR